MKKKGVGNKLAAAVRQAREGRVVQAHAAETKPAVKPQTRRADAPAMQNDQSPAPSLDSPWENLHPARIWPD